MTAKPTFLIIAGPNGAGKSTFNDQNRIGNTIDPDAIARGINPDAPESVSMAAGRIARQQVAEHISAGRSFTQETTLSAQQTYRDIEAAKAAGFTIKLEFIGIKDAEMSASRVADRVVRGGHDIPAEAIARRYGKVMENLLKAALKADETTIRDNENKDFKVILSIREGQIFERADDIPPYLQAVVTRIAEDLSAEKERRTLAAEARQLSAQDTLSPFEQRRLIEAVDLAIGPTAVNELLSGRIGAVAEITEGKIAQLTLAEKYYQAQQSNGRPMSAALDVVKRDREIIALTAKLDATHNAEKQSDHDSSSEDELDL